MGLFADAKVIKAKKSVSGKVEVKCKNKQCRKAFTAKAADIARGWGKYCSKSCKAIHQENRTGQYGQYLAGQHSEEGSNRWTDEDGNRKSRLWTGWGRSIVSTEDKMTGEITNEEFDKHGVSRGFQMSREQLSYGGYGDADEHSGFGDGKY
jgi:hypothetical protein